MEYFNSLRPEQLYPTLTLVAVVAAVDLGERLRPGFAVDRRRELSVNLAALLLAVFAGEWCKDAAIGGLRLLGAEGLGAAPLASLPTVLKLPLAVIITDFALYWVHRAMHNPRLLWVTHTFHHSIGEVWWLSGSRTSLAHLFLFAVPQMFIAHFLLRLNAFELTAAVSFGVAVNIWIHANMWVNLGPLEKVFITPNFHRIHHGAKGLSNRNLGFVLTVWDRLFGTYTGTEATGRDFALFPVPSGGRLPRMMIGI